MIRWLKLSHHTHSGKLRGHEHTSYLPLGIILAIACVPLTMITVGAASPGPQSGSIGLSGTVPGNAPKIAAVIKKPNDGQHFTTTPVTISGTCEGSTLIELYKNDIFAGSTPCTNNAFTLDIDLMIGQNKVVAKTYDALNQAGPDSNSLTLYYDALAPQAASQTDLYFDGSQLILNTSAVFRGSFPGQSFDVPIGILGGTPPYAVNVEWGDNTNKVVSRDSSETFSLAHAYAKAGTYQITIQATDAKGRIAFLTVAAIVNGQVATAAATIAGSGTTGLTGNETINSLLILWPLYTASFAVVVSFWLGERREKRVLAKHGLLVGS